MDNNSQPIPVLETLRRGALNATALAALLLMGAQGAQAATETVLYSFKGGTDGAGPYFETPVLDKAGNLYGTTSAGGTYNLGTVWKLSPSGTETILWSFGNGTDGALPNGLATDSSGNFYATTNEGGADNLGTVVKITPSGTESVLLSLSGTDGSYPDGTEPVLDSNGNIYATAAAGGTYNGGTVLKITPSGGETVLWNFGNGNDQPAPGGMFLAQDGTLYGTSYGASDGEKPPLWGDVWQLTPSGNEEVLYHFDPPHTDPRDGRWPIANLVMDEGGNLYGTCHNGGYHNNGAVFKLTPTGIETAIHGFVGRTEGFGPYSDVLLKNGKLYSTNFSGNPYPQGGTVWEMTRSGETTVLYTFPFNNGIDGFGPLGGVAMDKQGNLYGTTFYGGTGGGQYGYGTVYKLTP